MIIEKLCIYTTGACLLDHYISINVKLLFFLIARNAFIIIYHDIIIDISMVVTSACSQMLHFFLTLDTIDILCLVFHAQCRINIEENIIRNRSQQISTYSNKINEYIVTLFINNIDQINCHN